MWQSIIAFLLSVTTYLSGQPSLPVASPTSNIPVSPTAREVIHVVKDGDDLADLAEEYYGNRDYWTSIWNDNPQVIHPDSLKQGMKLKIRTQKPGSTENIIIARMDALMADMPESPDPEIAFTQATEEIAYVPEVSEVQPTTVPQVQAAVATDYDRIYQEAGAKYGVPWQVLYGLHLTETGQRDGAISSGYGTGAQGPMQFMPGTWNAYGVDGNGDGVADINNAEDAIHGAANYLAQHGGVEQGLQYYGGNTSGTLTAACQRGYCQ